MKSRDRFKETTALYCYKYRHDVTEQSLEMSCLVMNQNSQFHDHRYIKVKPDKSQVIDNH